MSEQDKLVQIQKPSTEYTGSPYDQQLKVRLTVQVFRIPGIFLMPATLMIPIFERSSLSFSMENPFCV